MLPIAGQSGTTSGGRSWSTYTDANSHADTTGSCHHLLGIYHTARIDYTSLVHFQLLVHCGPVLVVHEVMRMRGRRRGRRRQRRRGGGPRPGSLLRSQLIVARLAGNRGRRSTGWRYHLIVTASTATAAAAAEGTSRIWICYTVMMGARGSPRFASDLGPGSGIGVRLGTTRRMRIRPGGCR